MLCGVVLMKRRVFISPANPLSQHQRRMENDHTKQQPHQEAANVAEIVQTRKQPQYKRNDNIEENQCQISPGLPPLPPRIQQIQQLEGQHAKQRTRTPRRRNPIRRKVSTQDEPKDPARQIHEQEAQRADRALHVAAQRHLQQQVEPDVHDARVQEDGHDEAEPLVGRGLVVEAAARVRIRHAGEAAELGERAFGRGRDGGGVGTGEAKRCGGEGVVLDAGGVAHAGDVAGAHVDEDVGGWADHGVELRVDLDGGVGEGSWWGHEGLEVGLGRDGNGNLPFLMISAMKTTSWTRVKK